MSECSLISDEVKQCADSESNLKGESVVFCGMVVKGEMRWRLLVWRDD